MDSVVDDANTNPTAEAIAATDHLPPFSDQEIFDRALPTLSEKYILAAAGMSSNITEHELFQVMTLQSEDRKGEFSPAELELRNHYHRHLNKTFGLDADPLTPDSARVFENPFMAGRTLVITDPGSLAFAGDANDHIVAGNIILVETPSRRIYDNLYRDGFETMLPRYVVLRAHIKMKVAGTDKALVYVVGDNHDIDEFHVVKRDEALIEQLEQGCRRAIKRVIDNDPPRPDITEDHHLINIREGNAPLVVSEDDNAFPMVRDLLDAITEEKRLSEPQKAAKKVVDELKEQVQGLMAENNTNMIVLPDSTRLRRKLINTKESVKPAGSYTRLDVIKPDR